MVTHKVLPREQDDSTGARIDLRLKYLGWTRQHLADAVTETEQRRTPLSETVIRNMVGGQRAISPNWLRRFATVLQVPEATLSPGSAWDPLVRGWFRHPCIRRSPE